MPLVSAYHLCKYFSERRLFDGVTFDIAEHDKIGLVGVNGCGKTTLFRLLTGEMTPDDGSLALEKNLTVGYLEQYTPAADDTTLWDELLTVFAPLMKTERELEEIDTRLLTDHSEELLLRQQHLRETFERDGGLYYRSRARAVLLGLGFSEDMFSRPLSQLSGGQRTKVAMGRLLLSNVKLLLLDEPTNHLDMEACEWLEEYLNNYTGAVLVISHDRYFLDRVTSRTFEIVHQKMLITEGNYSVHRARREKDEEIIRKHYKTDMKEIRHIEENIALLKQWNREKSIRAAESRQKLLDRKLEQLEIPPEEEKKLKFRFSADTVSGNEVLNIFDLSMGFGGKPLFSDVSMQIRRGERVFLLGPNGCGKTTLLKLVRGELSALSGEIKQGAKVHIGYYDQTQEQLSAQKTALDQIGDVYPEKTQTELRCALAAFLFRGDDVFKPVSALSGGEKARLLLLTLMLSGSNFLLLDEPTNHLDIPSREALEEALEEYDGTLLVVSHDRYFINRLATRVLHLTADGCETCGTGYDDYCAKLREKTEETPVAVTRTENTYKQRKEQESARRKDRTRLKRLEEAISAAEEDIADVEKRLATDEVAADYEQLMALTEQLKALQDRLNEQMAEWEELFLRVGEDAEES